MTIYNATSEALTTCILEISKAHSPYVFITEYSRNTGIVIKFQSSNNKSNKWKRYLLSHSQAETFATCCAALSVPVYYIKEG